MTELDEQIKIYKAKVAEEEASGHQGTHAHSRLLELLAMRKERYARKRKRKTTLSVKEQKNHE